MPYGFYFFKNYCINKTNMFLYIDAFVGDVNLFKNTEDLCIFHTSKDAHAQSFFYY